MEKFKYYAACVGIFIAVMLVGSMILSLIGVREVRGILVYGFLTIEFYVAISLCKKAKKKMLAENNEVK